MIVWIIRYDKPLIWWYKTEMRYNCARYIWCMMLKIQSSKLMLNGQYSSKMDRGNLEVFIFQAVYKAIQNVLSFVLCLTPGNFLNRNL
jgi:hypothetical protein